MKWQSEGHRRHCFMPAAPTPPCRHHRHLVHLPFTNCWQINGWTSTRKPILEVTSKMCHPKIDPTSIYAFICRIIQIKNVYIYTTNSFIGCYAPRSSSPRFSADLGRCRTAFTPGAEAGRSREPRAEWTWRLTGFANPNTKKQTTKNQKEFPWVFFHHNFLCNHFSVNWGEKPDSCSILLYTPHILGGTRSIPVPWLFSLGCHTCMVTAVSHCTRITGLSLTLSD